MSLPDATAIAALQAEVIKPVFFAFLDINGGQVRCNTSGADVTPSGTGEADLDSKLFTGISGAFIDIGEVAYRQGGSESVTATLSGIPELDAVSIALLANPANWRGRDARLWRVIRNAANVQQGGFHAYYTGRMTGLEHSADENGQTITVTIESYLAVFSEASNRTYLSQDQFDSGDLSARAAVAIANGNYTGAVTGSGYSGQSGVGGGGGAYWNGGGYVDLV